MPAGAAPRPNQLDPSAVSLAALRQAVEGVERAGRLLGDGLGKLGGAVDAWADRQAPSLRSSEPMKTVREDNRKTRAQQGYVEEARRTAAVLVAEITAAEQGLAELSPDKRTDLLASLEARTKALGKYADAFPGIAQHANTVTKNLAKKADALDAAVKGAGRGLRDVVTTGQAVEKTLAETLPAWKRIGASTAELERRAEEERAAAEKTKKQEKENARRRAKSKEDLAEYRKKYLEPRRIARDAWKELRDRLAAEAGGGGLTASLAEMDAGVNAAAGAFDPSGNDLAGEIASLEKRVADEADAKGADYATLLRRAQVAWEREMDLRLSREQEALDKAREAAQASFAAWDERRVREAEAAEDARYDAEQAAEQAQTAEMPEPARKRPDTEKETSESAAQAAEPAESPAPGTARIAAALDELRARRDERARDAVQAIPTPALAEEPVATEPNTTDRPSPEADVQDMKIAAAIRAAEEAAPEPREHRDASKEPEEPAARPAEPLPDETARTEARARRDAANLGAALAAAGAASEAAEEARKNGPSGTEEAGTALPTPSPVPEPAAGATILDIRQTLRTRRNAAQADARMLATYEERLQARGWEYLQRTQPEWVESIRFDNVEISGYRPDPSPYLTDPEARAEVQQLAIADVRATFPEATDERLSAALLARAGTVIGAAQTGAEALAAGTGLTLLKSVEAAGALEAARFAGSARVAAVAMQGVASLFQRAIQAQGALASHLQAAEERGAALRRGAGDGAAARDLEPLRAAQREAPAEQRALQAELHAALRSIEDAQTLADTVENGIGGTRASRAALVAGKLEGVLERAVRQGRAPARAPDPKPVPGKGRDTGTEAPAPAPSDEADTARSRAEYEAGLAGKLAAQQLRDRRFNELRDTAAGTSASPGGTVVENAGSPIEALPSRRPLSATQAFGAEQAAMARRTRTFLGSTGSVGGFEAAFDEGRTAAGDDRPSPGDDGSFSAEEEAGPDDDTEAADTQEDEQVDGEEEARREAQLLEEQQRARNSDGQDGSSGGSNALDTINRLKNNPLAKKLGGQGGKAALANPYVLAIVALVVIIWFNIRLLAPKEGSLVRKPLGGGGKLGTIVFDLFFVTTLLLTFFLLVFIMALPFLPILLAGGALSSIIETVLQ